MGTRLLRARPRRFPVGLQHLQARRVGLRHTNCRSLLPVWRRLMGKWKIACGAALLSLGLAPSAHADEFTKLTLLTFSGPVEVPGISLPAGTYRFQLADPTTGRR